MKNCNINGSSTLDGGLFDKISVNGSGSFLNKVESNTFSINGKCECNDAVVTKDMKVKGVATFNAELTADELLIGGYATMHSNLKTNNLEVKGILKVKDKNKIEATTINCKGIIMSDYEIYVDDINVDGIISATGLYGDNIKIKMHEDIFSKLVKHIPIVNNKIERFSKIDIIEATTINIENTKVNTLNGRDIRIGKNCVVESVDALNSLIISKSAIVNNIACDYTIED